VWTEIFLLSLGDVLVTTSQYTFGYVAQGLAGLEAVGDVQAAGRRRHSDGAVSDLPCGRATSMEPCFFAAPNYTISGRSNGWTPARSCHTSSATPTSPRVA